MSEFDFSKFKFQPAQTVQDPEPNCYDVLTIGNYWDLMTDEDRQYARTSPNQDLCPWCKRRTSHHQSCMVDSDEWAVKMPFGKYKDTPIRNIDPSYLYWVLSESGMELTEDIEQAIRTLLFQA